MVFNLFDIILLLVIIVVVIQFWRVRAITEYANQYLHRYCENNQLQLVSVARRKTRLATHRGKIDWYSEFDFEFSGNGEDSSNGQLFMRGLSVEETVLPAYRI